MNPALLRTNAAAGRATLPRSERLASDILAAVHEQLRASSHYFVRAVTCEFERGVLILRGRVPSFYLKQLAQTLVRRVAGVDQVKNLVDVASPTGIE
jgi:osmotically-inducible protein OsmY